jgi:hypothetical protein
MTGQHMATGHFYFCCVRYFWKKSTLNDLVFPGTGDARFCPCLKREDA